MIADFLFHFIFLMSFHLNKHISITPLTMAADVASVELSHNLFYQFPVTEHFFIRAFISSPILNSEKKKYYMISMPIFRVEIYSQTAQREHHNHFYFHQ